MKPPGDIIKAILAPFVRNTKYENCGPCEKRRAAINNFWTKVLSWISKK